MLSPISHQKVETYSDHVLKKYMIKKLRYNKYIFVKIYLGLKQETKTFIFDEFSLLFLAEASSDHAKLKIPLQCLKTTVKRFKIALFT